jgi:tight adherence protein C
MVWVFFGILLIVCAYLYYDMQITDISDARRDDIERDWADVVSKLTLLINAGMIMSEAWVKVSETGDSALYKEMRTAVLDMRNGVPDREAYMSFADRCMNVKVKKIMSAIVQNIDKGNSELVGYLKGQNSICWEEKKQYVKTKGEEASGKLLLPICIMFIGILIMVVVPIFVNL